MTADLQQELLGVIERRILAHPRSQQKEIGPSGLGTGCLRKLGHRLAETPAARPETPAWRPTVGVAAHYWLEMAMRADNARLGRERWLLEHRVTVGTVGGRDVQGNADVFDTDTGTVLDWKVPGITTIKAKRKADHPGVEYQVQCHLYGWGFALMGFDVKHVAIYFLPAAGELGDGYYWSEPYDPAIAEDAIKRADGLAAGIAIAGPGVILPQLPTAPDYCNYCPWHVPETTDLARECPGDASYLAGLESKLKKATSGPAFGQVAPIQGEARCTSTN